MNIYDRIAGKTYPYVGEPVECTCYGITVTHWHGKVVTGKGTGEFTGAEMTPELANEAAERLLEEIKERGKS